MTASAALAYTSNQPSVIPLHVLAPKKAVAHSVGTSCSTCNLRELCLPCGLTGQDIEHMDELIHSRKRVKRGQSLYHAGEEFHSMYAVRSGFFKTNLLLEDGREQVTGFHMMGEIIGMDGIGAGAYASSAIALEDSEVCALPYTHLEKLSRSMPSLQPHFHRVMSREIVREHSVMLLLGGMRADQRLATFLLNLSLRFTMRGYSPSEFNLRMTREEIGSYLGMKLETVSRMFSKFQDDGLIGVQQKLIQILDVSGLNGILGRELH
jgi:CRP/FNR family transcriptional regulator